MNRGQNVTNQAVAKVIETAPGRYRLARHGEPMPLRTPRDVFLRAVAAAEAAIGDAEFRRDLRLRACLVARRDALVRAYARESRDA